MTIATGVSELCSCIPKNFQKHSILKGVLKFFELAPLIVLFSMKNCTCMQIFRTDSGFAAGFFLDPKLISTFRIVRVRKNWAFLKSTSNFRSFATKLALLSLSVQKWQAKESYYPHGIAKINCGVMKLFGNGPV